MVGFLFYSELGQHGRLSILFGTWAALSAFLFYKLGSMVGFPILNLDSMVRFLFTSSTAWSALYSELGQHGRLCILNLDSMVGFLFRAWAAWPAFYSGLG